MLVLLENSAVLGGGAAVVSAARMRGRGDGSELIRSPLFAAGLILLAVDAAVSSVMSLMLEKDAMGRLFAHVTATSAAAASAVPLERANAAITRADLVASVGVYVLLGYATRRGDSGSGGGSESLQAADVLAWLAAWHVIAGAVVLMLLQRLWRAAPETFPNSSPTTAAANMPAVDGGGGASRIPFVQLLLSGPQTIRQLPRASRLLLCAFVCLFSTVLSPSSLLTACLRSRGVTAPALAHFRAAAQLAGALGTAVAPPLIKRLGPLRAGFHLQRLQFGCVALATLALVCPRAYWPPPGRAVPSREQLVMLGVASSRIGLWGFDLSERQALQTAAVGLGEGRDSGGSPGVTLFATEKALTEAAGLAMLVVSLPLSDVDSFGVLATLSLLAVAFAAVLVKHAQVSTELGVMNWRK